jgi:hypothetical protein
VRRARQKVFAGIVVASMALVIPLSLIGQAHTFTAESRVTIRYGTVVHRFMGHVSSARQGCERGRTVLVFKVQPGANRFIGSDKTNASGVWSIPRPNPHGWFYARAPRRVTLTYGHSHECLSDRSPTIFVQ